ncbi:MAG: creatininase family protein [Gammaproteobacteria bacterium]|nr:creatininase family protein [Gammaproteobacteria bacterium]
MQMSQYFNRPVHVAIALLCFAPQPGVAGILQLADMTSEEYRNLQHDRTVVLMPLGVIEEHGPYLPMLTDSYIGEWLVDRVAAAIDERDGWSVVIMPSLPIGAGAPEDFAPRARKFGSLPLRPETKRAVLMDLVSGLGDAGFRWIFAVDIHGPYLNKRMTDQVASYFDDIYGGTMVNLTGVVHPGPVAKSRPYSERDAQEDGLAIHAGLGETSWMLHVRPDLVRSDHVTASAVTIKRWREYEAAAKGDNWPGYFGTPRLASVAAGDDQMSAWASNVADLAVKIIDGLNPAQLEHVAAGRNPALRRLDRFISERAALMREQQAQWLERNEID